MQPSSSACRGNSPPLTSTSSYSPAPQGGESPVIAAAPSRKTANGVNYRGSSTPIHAKPDEAKHVKSRMGAHTTTSSSASNSTHHHRGGRGRCTPSPPSNAHHRSGSGMGVGNGGCGSTRNAPYHSPRDSPRGGGALRGVARNSPPMERNSNVGVTLRGVVRSPTHGSPRNSLHSDTGFSLSTPYVQGVNHTHHSGSSSPELSPGGNGAHVLTRKPLFINLNETPPLGGSYRNDDITIRDQGDPLLSPPANPVPLPPLQRTLSPYQTTAQAPPTLTSASFAHHQGESLGNSPPLVHNSNSLSPHAHDPPPGGPIVSGSQSPPHTLNFEDGRVLSQLPYEYSSFLDLPPAALGWFGQRN